MCGSERKKKLVSDALYDRSVHFRIGSQVWSDFLDGKGTFIRKHIIVEVLFLGMKWLTAIF